MQVRCFISVPGPSCFVALNVHLACLSGPQNRFTEAAASQEGISMTGPRPDSKAADATEKRQLDRAVEEGLGDSLPGSGAAHDIQPPPSKANHHVKRKD